MNSRIAKSAIALAMAGGLLISTAQAYEAGNWLLKVGVADVIPKSNNSDIVDVTSAFSLTLDVTYMLTPNWGVDLLAAWPFTHDIELKDGTTVGQTKQLPPTLSLQYHFLPQNNIRPYLGLGVNYTFFFDEETSGPLRRQSLSLGSSWGLAAEVGVDISINDDWFFNADLRYMDIDTDAKLDGANLTTVNIDPVVVGISIGRRF